MSPPGVICGTGACSSGGPPRCWKILPSISPRWRINWRAWPQPGGPDSPKNFRRLFPKFEKISIDFAIMEKISDIHAVAADIGWNDVGSWAVVYDLTAKDSEANVRPAHSLCLDSRGNMIVAKKKFVVTVGVQDLVIVETDDALLVCPRDRSQDVGKAVQAMEKAGLQKSCCNGSLSPPECPNLFPPVPFLAFNLHPLPFRRYPLTLCPWTRSSLEPTDGVALSPRISRSPTFAAWRRPSPNTLREESEPAARPDCRLRHAISLGGICPGRRRGRLPPPGFPFGWRKPARPHRR